MFKKFIVFCCGLVCLAIISSVAAYFWLVIYSPGEAIKQENIEKILSMESPVFYSDAETKIGVFFQEAHRQYVPYKKLPTYFVNGLVASEDHDFFSHYGVDFSGFTRALIANVKARKIVQGGSTITQQTAKNLFKRKGRSVRAKLYELLYALRLEYHYPKEKILEFYANQFYVSGNGHGLGVAAHYYFDKEPQDLDLVESAFIVGSVKRPNYYNPFIKKDLEGAEKARERAKKRTAYVLGQMYKLAMIDSTTYQQALDKDIPFQQGEMRFKLNTLMDLVRDGLDDPVIKETLEEHGIENVSTSGLQVITSIDRKLQEKSFSALRSELSRLDVRLNGYKRDILQKRYADLPFVGSNDLKVGQFLVARVIEVVKGSQPSIQVNYRKNPNSREVRGTIEESGLQPIVSAYAKYLRQRWSQANIQDMTRLLDEIKERDLVYVSVLDYDPLTSQYAFKLEKYPELQGASIAMQNGMIKALVGGVDNFYYNRAIQAKRPMGSVIKPLVYAAAIQLGWNSLDLLDNQRNMFVFHDSYYFPRPDHESPHKKVSMSWAGVHSENVASVWLLYHLCDRLNPAQFKELLVNLEMARMPGESYSYYKRKVRDEMGILVNQQQLKRAAFEKAIEASGVDLIFSGNQAELDMLHLFHFSDRSEQYAADEEQKQKDKEKGESKESKIRGEIILRSFERILSLRNELQIFSEGVGLQHEIEKPASLYYLPMESHSIFGYSLEGTLENSSFIFSKTYPGGGWKRLEPEDLIEYLAGKSDHEKKDFVDKIRLDNLLSVETVDLVNGYFNEEYERLRSLPAYGPEVLHFIRDFRILAGLKYLIVLCREIGVKSTLEPVLSFPLGSNVMSLLEVAQIYEALTSGVAYSHDNSDNLGRLLIESVRDPDGQIIYQSSIQEKNVIDQQTAVAVSDILRNVVKYGTGRYAKRNIRVHSSDPETERELVGLNLGMPVFGKTGTANRFTNAAFAGVVPTPTEKRNGVSLSESYSIASYVGFDNNRPMERHTTHITGASGALPLWTKIVNGLIYDKNYGSSVDLVDLIFGGKEEIQLIYPDIDQIEVLAAVDKGGVAVGTGQKRLSSDASYEPVTSFGVFRPDGGLNLTRYFRPFWHQNPALISDPSIPQ